MKLVYLDIRANKDFISTRNLQKDGVVIARSANNKLTNFPKPVLEIVYLQDRPIVFALTTDVSVNDAPLTHRQTLHHNDRLTVGNHIVVIRIDTFVKMLEGPSNYIALTNAQERTLQARIDNLGSWLSAQCEKVGKGTETRLQSGNVTGILKTDSTNPLTFELRAELPYAPATISLKPQLAGVRGFIQALFEHKVGDDELDDLFYIKAASSDDEHLLKLKDKLVTLGKASTSVEFQNEELLVKGTIAFDEFFLVLECVFLLWQKSVDARQGLS